MAGSVVKEPGTPLRLGGKDSAASFLIDCNSKTAGGSNSCPVPSRSMTYEARQSSISFCFRSCGSELLRGTQTPPFLIMASKATHAAGHECAITATLVTFVAELAGSGTDESPQCLEVVARTSSQEGEIQGTRPCLSFNQRMEQGVLAERFIRKAGIPCVLIAADSCHVTGLEPHSGIV
jgi:hypothetical protein